MEDRNGVNSFFTNCWCSHSLLSSWDRQEVLLQSQWWRAVLPYLKRRQIVHCDSLTCWFPLENFWFFKRWDPRDERSERQCYDLQQPCACNQRSWRPKSKKVRHVKWRLCCLQSLVSVKNLDCNQCRKSLFYWFKYIAKCNCESCCWKKGWSRTKRYGWKLTKWKRRSQ